MFKLFFYSLVCLVCFASCSKSGNDLDKLNRTGLTYIQLRPNQYFIYRDSASGRLDSVVVTESSLSTESYTVTSRNSITTRTREVFSLTLTRKGTTGDSVWIKGQAKGNLIGNTNLKNLNGTPIFVYPAACLCTDLYELPSFTVEGKTYSKVIVLESSITAPYITTFYWAPSVGIIKMIKKTSGANNQSWSHTLVRNN